jgi:hypothetical protein
MRDSDLAHLERQRRRRPGRTIGRLAQKPVVRPRGPLMRLLLRCWWVLLHPTRDVGPLWRESAVLVGLDQATIKARSPESWHDSGHGPRALWSVLALLLVQTD